MVKSIWEKISNIGVNDSIPKNELTYIILLNHVLCIITLLSLILSAIVYVKFGWKITSPTVLASTILYGFLLFLNHLGYSKLSRFLLSTLIPIFIIAMSVASKINTIPPFEPYEFFEFRFLLLISPVIPLSLFSSNDLKLLVLALLPGLAVLIGFDFVHNFFGIGYEQTGLALGNYHFINLSVFIGYFLLVSSLIFLKIINSKLLVYNSRLIDSLHQKNDELRVKNVQLAAFNLSIEQQNEEILQQAEELKKSQMILSQNHEIIKLQAEDLTKKNKDLESEIMIKNSNLTKTNQELIQHNNELRQFSYSLSHNLRGPVASLIGLVNIFHDEKDQHNSQVIGHIKNSTILLDSVIKDLSKVIETRNSIYEIKENVDFAEEMEKVKKLLNDQIKETKSTIITDFKQVGSMYAVKAFISSILYNLVSNSIKYRYPGRPPTISVSSRLSEDEIALTVTDNGLGINLNAHRNDIFKLYKRFHIHTEGKGLGLYLVQLQTDMLKGKVSIESKVNHGTTITLSFKNDGLYKFDHLFEDENAVLFHDQQTNSSGIEWKKKPTEKIFKKVFEETVKIVEKHPSPNWIVNWQSFAAGSHENYRWLFKTILPIAVRIGIKQIVMIVNDEIRKEHEDTIAEMESRTKKINLDVVIFKDYEKARNWLINTFKKNE